MLRTKLRLCPSMDIVKLSLRDALEEIASEGVEDARLNDEHAFDICHIFEVLTFGTVEKVSDFFAYARG